MRVILLDTLRSMVRSPISTTRPPRMSGSTCVKRPSRQSIESPPLERARGHGGDKRKGNHDTLRTLVTTFGFLPAPTYALRPTAVSSWRTVRDSSGAALVITTSTSPRAAPISVANLPHTPGSTPRRLFSARVSRKVRSVEAPVPPAVIERCSSTITCCLSAGESVGAVRMAGRRGSRSSVAERLSSARATASRVWVFAAAVYWWGGLDGAERGGVVGGGYEGAGVGAVEAVDGDGRGGVDGGAGVGEAAGGGEGEARRGGGHAGGASDEAGGEHGGWWWGGGVW